MKGTGRPQVLWVRNDLRLHDQPALHAALASGPVVALFVVDRRLVAGPRASPNRTWFLAGALRELEAGFRARGGRLVVREGQPEAEVPRFVRECDATVVHVTRDITPFARRRDRLVARALSDISVDFFEHPGRFVHAPDAEGLPRGARVYGSFRRAWGALPPREVLPAPERIPAPGSVPGGAWPAVFEQARPTANEPPLPGEEAARARLRAWVEGPLAHYAEQRDRLDLDGTSRLSQDLRFGLLSPLEVLRALPAGLPGTNRFVDELAWREFFAHVAWWYPASLREGFRSDAGMAWERDPAAFAAWQEGRTGYPVVDAAMHQLVATGWMHNRARMIAASFLAKHLLIDWRAGEAFFMAHLVDGDPASNAGGWQWTASTGTDPQPYFRVFNPVLQGRRHDPAGAYVRRWLPALRHVPAAAVHGPWELSRAAQEATGCLIGRDYPPPIVDHAAARARALARFAAAFRAP